MESCHSISSSSAPFFQGFPAVSGVEAPAGPRTDGLSGSPRWSQKAGGMASVSSGVPAWAVSETRSSLPSFLFPRPPKTSRKNNKQKQSTDPNNSSKKKEQTQRPTSRLFQKRGDPARAPPKPPKPLLRLSSMFSRLSRSSAAKALLLKVLFPHLECPMD